MYKIWEKQEWPLLIDTNFAQYIEIFYFFQVKEISGTKNKSSNSVTDDTKLKVNVTFDEKPHTSSR